MDIVNELKKERHEIRKRMQSIVEIISANTNFKGDVSKSVIHDSTEVVIQLTKMKEGSINSVEDFPFDSDIYLLDGELDVENENTVTKLTHKNPLIKLLKGDSANGKANKDSLVITKIKMI